MNLPDQITTVTEIIDFFIPVDVLSAVLMVFVLENVLEIVVGSLTLGGWIGLYVVGLLVVSAMQYLSADEDERDELHDDIEDL